MGNSLTPTIPPSGTLKPSPPSVADTSFVLSPVGYKRIRLNNEDHSLPIYSSVYQGKPLLVAVVSAVSENMLKKDSTPNLDPIGDMVISTIDQCCPNNKQTLILMDNGPNPHFFQHCLNEAPEGNAVIAVCRNPNEASYLIRILSGYTEGRVH